MLHIKTPTRAKHLPEFRLLANLRMAALVAGARVSESERVQVRAAELLKHLCTALPSPEFQAEYMYRAGELGFGLVLRVDHNMSSVTIRRVTADNVVSLHKVSISTVVGGAQ
jgi:hypothetical protein